MIIKKNEAVTEQRGTLPKKLQCSVRVPTDLAEGHAVTPRSTLSEHKAAGCSLYRMALLGVRGLYQGHLEGRHDNDQPDYAQPRRLNNQQMCFSALEYVGGGRSMAGYKVVQTPE